MFHQRPHHSIAGRLACAHHAKNRRPDVVIFLNGLPLGILELKNAADEEATIWSAYKQLQTYKSEIPSLLHYNAALVLSEPLGKRKAFGLALGMAGMLVLLGDDLANIVTVTFRAP